MRKKGLPLIVRPGYDTIYSFKFAVWPSYEASLKTGRIKTLIFQEGGSTMAVYRCRVCGYIFDEEKEGKSIRDIDICPRCKQPDDMFVLVEEKSEDDQQPQFFKG